MLECLIEYIPYKEMFPVKQFALLQKQCRNTKTVLQARSKKLDEIDDVIRNIDFSLILKDQAIVTRL
jgi:hypothetical protein